MLKELNKCLPILTSPSLRKLPFVTPVEQTDASKVRRGQAAFVHEVVKTDAPKRIDQMNEVDASSFTLD